MATVDPIRVKGLRDLQAALKALDGESQKAIRVALNNAVELIAVDARRKVPYQSGAVRASIKAQSSQREARVAAGGRRAPHYPWLDYGGAVGIGRSVKRPFRKEGRYLYPAYHRNRDDMLDMVSAELARVAEAAGLTVT